MTKAKKKVYEQTALKTANSAEMRALVNESLADMDAMQATLEASGMNPVDAELAIKQAYFKNLKMAGDPATMMQKSLAELATRIELDRVINPETDLVSDKYRELLDLQMKAIKTLHSIDKQSSANIHKHDDGQMKFADFIDVEVDQ
jgi:hypothetical protein